MTRSEQQQEETVDVDAQLQQMSKDQMATYLRMVLDDEPHVKTKLLQALSGPKTATSKSQEEWILLADVGEQATAKQQAMQQQAEEERDRQHALRMESIREKEEGIRKEIYNLIDEGGQKPYTAAMEHLRDLKAMYTHYSLEEQFTFLVRDIASTFSRKSAMMRRLRNARWV